MTNKLRLTTAIIVSLAGLGLSVAVAQTTVSGNAAFGFIAGSNDDATKKTGSFSSMTKETQINVGTKGKLNNGMNYAAGFSLEFDGPDTGATGMYSEGNYIEINSGDTTFMVGADRIQNGDRHVTNANGIGYIGQDGIGGVAKTADGHLSIFPRHGSIYQFFGAGITQKVGNGGISFYYVPNMTTTLLNEIGNDAETVAIANDSSATNKGKAYEFGYLGDLGVKGLTVQAFQTNGDKQNRQLSGDKKVKSTNLGVSYKMGDITVAASQLKTEGVQNGWSRTSSTLTSGELSEELKGQSVGVSFAATKDLTLGLAYGKADSNHASSVEDEKTTIASIGYSLGAIGIKAQVANVDNFAGIANNDGKMARVLMFTSF